jgi:hypothetical protein
MEPLGNRQATEQAGWHAGLEKALVERVRVGFVQVGIVHVVIVGVVIEASCERLTRKGGVAQSRGELNFRG